MTALVLTRTGKTAAFFNLRKRIIVTEFCFLCEHHLRNLQHARTRQVQRLNALSPRSTCVQCDGLQTYVRKLWIDHVHAAEHRTDTELFHSPEHL